MVYLYVKKQNLGKYYYMLNAVPSSIIATRQEL